MRKLVEERTSEIELQKEKLEDQAVLLQTNMKDLIEHQDEVSRQNEILVKQNQKITHQKEELITLSKKVQEANIDKIAFFTNITHEFRTPITLILGPVERALKLSTNPSVLEQLDIVKRNSRLLLSLINQLMDFRKVDSGKMELAKTSQNFIEFLDDLILPFEDLVKERGINFRKQYRINPPEFLFDRDNMQKVIGNLLSNAIKFTPDQGTITVIASTYTDKSDHLEKLYLAVKDTGKGIPQEDLEKIFERFYQSKQNQSYSGYGQSGTGIGLYLCKRIIQLHNGKIEARNQNSGGSNFRFIIPIERRLSTVVSVDGKPMEMIVANAVDEQDSITQEISKGKPVLLIVEDNPDMRHYIRSILSDEFNVLEAGNGVIGLEITNRYQPRPDYQRHYDARNGWHGVLQTSKDKFYHFAHSGDIAYRQILDRHANRKFPSGSRCFSGKTIRRGSAEGNYSQPEREKETPSDTFFRKYGHRGIQFRRRIVSTRNSWIKR